MYIYNYWEPYSHSVFKIIVFLRDFLKEQIELVLTISEMVQAALSREL